MGLTPSQRIQNSTSVNILCISLAALQHYDARNVEKNF